MEPKKSEVDSILQTRSRSASERNIQMRRKQYELLAHEIKEQEKVWDDLRKRKALDEPNRRRTTSLSKKLSDSSFDSTNSASSIGYMSPSVSGESTASAMSSISIVPITPSTSETAKLKSKVDSLKEELTTIKQERDKERSFYHEQIKQLTIFKKDRESSRESINDSTVTLAEKLDKKNAKLKKTIEDLEETRSTLETLQITIEATQDMRSKLSRQLEEEKKNRIKYEKLAKERKKSLREARDQAAAANAEKDEVLAELEQLRSNHENLKMVLDEMSKEIQSLEANSSSSKRGSTKKKSKRDSHSHSRSGSTAEAIIEEVAARSRAATAVQDLSRTPTDYSSAPVPAPDTASPIQRSSTSPSLTGVLSPKSEPKKVMLSIHSPKSNVTLSTAVSFDWKVSDLISRIARKFPDTGNLHLFLRISKGVYLKLDEDKLVSTYKQIEDPKIAPLEYSVLEEYASKDKKKQTFKRVVNYSHAHKEVPVEPEKANFHLLIKEESYERIKSLLKLDIVYDLSVVNAEGDIPLYAAIRKHNVKLFNLFLDYYEKMNIDINARDKFGWSILHWIASNCGGNDVDDEIFKRVLKYPGIIVDSENDDRNTPLHYFCQKYKSTSCREIGGMLIDRAPHLVNLRNRNGETPLHKAIFNPAVRVLMCKLLISRGVDVNVANSKGETALHYSSRLGRKDLVKLLLHAGADFTIQAENASTALDLAVQANQEETVEILKSAQDLAKFLEEAGLREYLLGMISQDITIETLAQATDSSINGICAKLRITAVGTRLKLTKACEVLQDKVAKKSLDIRIRKAKRRPSFEPNSGVNEMKQSLQKLMEEGNDERWLLKHSDLEFTKELGAGTSGRVFKGLYKDARVAIKVLKITNKDDLEEFRKEFLVLSVISSPHIVHFFGACLEPKVCMVMEYCSRGSLLKVLKSEKEIDWDQGIEYAVQMARGLKSLHTWQPPIVHRDMKTPNLLINEESQLKICDMGLARFNTPDTENSMKRLCGTYCYTAPEVFNGELFTVKADIFSCGIVLWEIAYRVVHGKYQAPYAEFTHITADFQIALYVSEHQLRNTIPDAVQKEFPELAVLIRKCTEHDPAERPNAADMLLTLENIQKKMRKESNAVTRS
eukprot:TRINITY_DN3544_c0_g1_i1.p1 TRINITY_DN3544_c0_g1~~TRINITY_DN3544_c0_g1_i1.p1  ORF type:complete len:1120 (+),score=330.70 TRINITY_DN3544_c0_g1_i1:85-3444(+)